MIRQKSAGLPLRDGRVLNLGNQTHVKAQILIRFALETNPVRIAGLGRWCGLAALESVHQTQAADESAGGCDGQRTGAGHSTGTGQPRPSVTAIPAGGGGQRLEQPDPIVQYGVLHGLSDLRGLGGR